MGFSERLKELREKRDLSQESLAKLLNIPRTTLSHYESSGERMPRKERLQEIADFFNVSVDYLIGRTNEYYTPQEERLLIDIDRELSIEELKEKYVLKVDGQPATKEEIEGAIAFIRSLRFLK
jgi:transcriptional regulator with XRE-family HTH domain